MSILARRGPLLLLLGAAAGGLALFLAGLRALPPREPPMPVLATVPAFQLVSSAGDTVSRRDLLGHPWVVDLFFTSCAGVCPRMTSEMARLEERSRDIPEARFASISVDPERDTPEVLTAYARRLGVERPRWLFLTGDPSAVSRLAASGLLLPAQAGDPSRGDDAVVHSSRFVLLDSQARVRGFYDSRDPGALLRLRADLRRVDQAPTS